MYKCCIVVQSMNYGCEMRKGEGETPGLNSPCDRRIAMTSTHDLTTNALRRDLKLIPGIFSSLKVLERYEKYRRASFSVKGKHQPTPPRARVWERR